MTHFCQIFIFVFFISLYCVLWRGIDMQTGVSSTRTARFVSLMFDIFLSKKSENDEQLFFNCSIFVFSFSISHFYFLYWPIPRVVVCGSLWRLGVSSTQIARFVSTFIIIFLHRKNKDNVFFPSIALFSFLIFNFLFLY